MALDGIGTSPFGTPPIAPSRPVVDRSARERTERGSKESGDARAAFDAGLQALLGADAASAAGNATSSTGTASLVDTYSPRTTTPPTYTAQGRLADSLNKPASVIAAPVSGSNLASQPTAIPAGADANPEASADETSAAGSAKASSKGNVKTPGELSQAEREQVSKLQQRDQEVRAHEQAHQATGGEHAGGVSYTYQRGPDNRQYAVGGSVPIDVSPVSDDPEATVQKAEKVRAAAMAPASPSGQDQQVAAKASQMAAKARAEQAEKQLNPDKDDEGGKVGSLRTADETSNEQKAAKADTDANDAGKAAASGLTAMAGGNAAAELSGNVTAARREAPATAVKNSAVTGMVQPAATTPPQDVPRPTDSTDAMSPEGRTGSGIEAAYSPAAQATRAAFAAVNSLDFMNNTARASDAGLNAQSATPAANRAMSRATAAYARMHGENALAPANTGISMSV